MYLEVSAEVRYWEDSKFNGVRDEAGTLVPFRDGDLWCPIIDLESGIFLDWPEGLEAKIHYKVCDQGEYWLLGDEGQRLFKYLGDYVPDEYLCFGDRGYGDYIIMNIDGTGKIQDYVKPVFSSDQWGKVKINPPAGDL